MMNLVQYTLSDVNSLQERVQAALAGSASLREAAQRCASAVYEDHQESVALVRVYATVPFGQLPPSDRSFVTALAESGGARAALRENTPVLSLLGTRGDKPDWDDRRKSNGHLGIPLVGASFVEAIPMVSRLMHDMGIGVEWLDTNDTKIVVKTIGRVAGVFYVRDAATGVDDKDRMIVPAQDFVRANGIKTVFGLGGSYLNGTCIILILFTRETMERAEVEKFMPLVSTIKSATMSVVMRDKIFS
jgi:hypothetical protein